MKSLVLGALLGLGLGACAGNTASLRASNQELSDQLERLREDARRDRAKTKDLETQLMLKESAAKTHASREERPELPVEVREPEGLGSETELPTDYQVMGINSDGVEIVYVGEAASDKVVKIPARSFRGSSTYDDGYDDGYDYVDEPIRPSLRTARRTAARSPAPSSVAGLTPIPEYNESLGVTDDVPTIASQLRQARAPLPKQRPIGRGVVDPRDDYRRYYEALQSGNHSFAVTGFRNFVKRYPGHDYADNAQYWLAEAMYDQKKYKEAAIEFQKVSVEHPQGNKVPDSLLKLGYCHMQLGRKDEAEKVWRQVLRAYPKSNPAALAEAKLRELEK